MRAKLLVFFGIVAVGIGISIFTLTKCGKSGGPGGELVSVEDPATSSGDPATPAPPAENDAPAVTLNPTPAEPETVVKTSDPAPTTPAPEVGNTPTAPAPATPAMVAATATTPGSPAATTPKPAPAPAATTPAGNAPAMANQGKAGPTPEGVVGGAANVAMQKNFQNFMGAAGDDAVPAEIRDRLKAVIEDPNLKLDPDRPFWEVAKTRDSVRWMLDFVPTKEGAGEPQSVSMDVAKLSDKEYKISKVSFPPTLKEVVAAIENPTSNTEVKVDSLNVAQAFSKAVLSEDFVSARKLCGPKVTDERIAGLMIALEEGKFAMREDRPLIVTFSRDTMSWILSRVNSPEHSSEFALELENNSSWKVNGLTFGKVIAALAKDVEGPYSPIVEDPTGGESLVVYFDFDAAGLSSRADNQLKIVANILKQDINRKIRITGHADALGSDDYNRNLSSKRAESIRQGIIARGANPDQVITEGYGESRPRKPNFKEDGTDNPVGRSENRRAEVYLDF